MDAPPPSFSSSISSTTPKLTIYVNQRRTYLQEDVTRTIGMVQWEITAVWQRTSFSPH